MPTLATSTRLLGGVAGNSATPSDAPAVLSAAALPYSYSYSAAAAAAAGEAPSSPLRFSTGAPAALLSQLLGRAVASSLAGDLLPRLKTRRHPVRFEGSGGGRRASEVLPPAWESSTATRYWFDVEEDALVDRSLPASRTCSSGGSFILGGGDDGEDAGDSEDDDRWN